MTTNVKQLLEITRCPIFNNYRNTPCEKIVTSQPAAPRQIPEPWNGDLQNAPILFISSNPAINPLEHYPTNSWTDNDIIDFFNNRFCTFGKYVKSALYPKLQDGYAKNWVRYWAGIRSIARQLLNNRNVIPGKDYAITEVVRCKSLNEIGVLEAMQTCAGLYLKKTLQSSGAKVIVVVGDKALSMLNEFLNMKIEIDKTASLNLMNPELPVEADRNCLVFAVPHTNSRKDRKLISKNTYTIEQIETIRQHLLNG